MSVSDILSMITVSKSFEESKDILVLPSSLDILSRLDMNRTDKASQLSNVGLVRDPLVTHKILPYTYNEPMNRINWKASARGQELLVNVEQPSYTSSVLIALNTYTSRRDSEKYTASALLLEKGIKLCATLLFLLDENTTASFISNAAHPGDIGNALIEENTDFVRTGEFEPTHDDKLFRRMLAELSVSYKTELADLIRQKYRSNPDGNPILVITPYIDDKLLSLHDEMSGGEMNVVFLLTQYQIIERRDIIYYYI